MSSRFDWSNAASYESQNSDHFVVSPQKFGVSSFCDLIDTLSSRGVSGAQLEGVGRRSISALFSKMKNGSVLILEKNALIIFNYELNFSFNSSRPDPGRREKNNLKIYFHTSLWCLRKFYEGL